LAYRAHRVEKNSPRLKQLFPCSDGHGDVGLLEATGRKGKNTPKILNSDYFPLDFSAAKRF